MIDMTKCLHFMYLSIQASTSFETFGNFACFNLYLTFSPQNIPHNYISACMNSYLNDLNDLNLTI